MSASDAEYVPIWDPEAAGPIEVGIDVIEIDRIAHVLDRFGDRFLHRIYTPRERERYGRRVSELAARFAAMSASCLVFSASAAASSSAFCRVSAAARFARSSARRWVRPIVTLSS